MSRRGIIVKFTMIPRPVGVNSSSLYSDLNFKLKNIDIPPITEWLR